MNEPKFEKGDEVQCKNHGTRFIVARIQTNLSDQDEPLYFPNRKQKEVYSDSCYTNGFYFGFLESILELVSSKLTTKQIEHLQFMVNSGGTCNIHHPKCPSLCAKEECWFFDECRIPIKNKSKAQQLLKENEINSETKFNLKESGMNKTIENLFSVTKDANLVSKYFNNEFENKLVAILAVDNVKQILAEAKRLEEESKKDQ